MRTYPSSMAAESYLRGSSLGFDPELVLKGLSHESVMDQNCNAWKAVALVVVLLKALQMSLAPITFNQN
jgi:hypothetical protein